MLEENDSNDLENQEELDVVNEKDVTLVVRLISERRDIEKQKEQRKRLEDELRKIEGKEIQFLEEEKQLSTNKRNQEKSEEHDKSDAVHESNKEGEEELSKFCQALSQGKNLKDYDISNEDSESEMKDTVSKYKPERTIPNQTMHTLNKNGINRGFYKDEERKKELYCAWKRRKF